MTNAVDQIFIMYECTKVKTYRFEKQNLKMITRLQTIHQTLLICDNIDSSLKDFFLLVVALAWDRFWFVYIFEFNQSVQTGFMLSMI